MFLWLSQFQARPSPLTPRAFVIFFWKRWKRPHGGTLKSVQMRHLWTTTQQHFPKTKLQMAGLRVEGKHGID